MVRYKMIGRDVNSYPIQYRTWVVNNTPDFEGYLYDGLKSGDSDFVDVFALEIQDGYAVVDFNLTDQLSWRMIEKTLPIMASDSQLAVVGDFVYLFGGQNSDVILRAELNNPADWEDTGARLPTTLGSSQLAIVDGYMYLFGGMIGSSTSDVIYQSTIDDPLSWVDSGSTLPSPLQNSQLGIADGYLHLFGGYTGTVGTGAIFRAAVDDPLIWSDTGDTLPNSIYGSQIGLIDGYFYLFGGTADGYSPLDSIYSSSLSDPTDFSLVGTLPLGIFYGQFYTLGSDGYIITPGAYLSGPNNVSPVSLLLKCNLSDPTDWEDWSNIDGIASQSQVAIIYDRVFLFGGNGSSLIYTTDLRLKYPITENSISQIYGNITRTQYQATVDPLDLIKVIGFPYWKTDY